MIKPAILWLMNVHKNDQEHVQKVTMAYKSVFLCDDGQEVLKDMALYCRQDATSFVPNDPTQTAFNEGARDVLLHIKEIMGLTFDDFPPQTQTKDVDNGY